LQCLGHTAAPEATSANEADQAGSPACSETGNFPNFPRANSALVESVTIPQHVSGPKPVNADENSTLSLAAKLDAPPTNLLSGERAQGDEPRKQNKKAKEAARPSSSAKAAADREDPVEKKGQRVSDAAKPAEEIKNKAAEEKKAAKRTKASDGPIRDASRADVANLLAMVKTLKEQVEGSNAKLMKQAQAAILSEERYREMRERELTEEDARAHAQAGEIARLQGQLDEAAAKQHEAPPKFQQLDDPEFAVRFESLMKTGLYSLEDVRAALETTKQDGKFSSTRADAYLKAILVSKRNDVLQRANQGVADDQPSIQPGSALARLLGTFGNEDAVDIVVKLKDVHAKRKTSHSAAPAVAASNLLQAAAVKGDCHLSRKGFAFLSHVATAVCEDCDKCQELRSEAEAAERWRATKAAAVAAASQSKKKGESAGHKRSPFLSLPFKTNDSRRDVRKPRSECAGCRKGAAGGKWLYFCDDCNRGFHSLCVDWKHLRHPSGGATWFSCADCVEQRDADIANGNDSRDYCEVSEEVEHGLAPVSAEASDSELNGGGPAQDANRQNDSQRGSGSTGGANALSASELGRAGQHSLATPPPTPRPASSSLLHLYGGTPYDQQNKLNLGTTGTGPLLSENKTTPSINVKDYFIWQAVPLDWAPKPSDGSKPESDRSRSHPECGYSKVAYQNWRRKNVTARDLVKGQGSTLGPLVRGISAEMKISIGRQFLRESALSWLWPKPIMDDEDVDEWAQSDPDFTWVSKIPDETLLSLLDKRFGVKKPDLFLSRKFYENLPTKDKHGDINYHADLFNRWATDWNTELGELIKSGCDFSQVNLREVLITALSTYPLIHREAKQYNTKSAYNLLAHLCDWVFQEEEAIISARNKRASLSDGHLPADHPHQPPGGNGGGNAGGGGSGGSSGNAGGGNGRGAPAQPKTWSGGGAAGQGSRNDQVSRALLTQLTQLAQQIGVDTGAAPGNPRPLPPHLKPHPSDSLKVVCRGCNNAWLRARSIPCYKGCRYAEHPHYNPQCNEKDGKQNPPLTWRNFREQFPAETPPKSFLRWEESQRTHKASKHPRDSA
jgi:hypothetical protein